MAWSINTYAGNDIYLPGNGGRIGMQQLMLAINEREWAIDRTETVWMLPDGVTEMARPGVSDLVGATVGIGSTIGLNCTRIRLAIIGLVGTGKFVNAVDSDTAWTMPTLYTAVGATLGNSTGPQDDAFLQTAKDILDRLIFVRHEIPLVGGEATIYYNDDVVLRAPLPTVPDPEGWNDAWAAMVSDTVTLPSVLVSPSGAPGADPSGILCGRQTGFLDAFPLDQFSTSMLTGGTVEADLSGLQGVVTSAMLDCEISAYNATYPPPVPHEFDFAGVTLTQALAFFDGVKEITSAVPSFDTLYDFPVSVITDGEPYPDTLSYRSDTGAYFGGGGYLRASKIIVYGDLTTVLTDQA